MTDADTNADIDPVLERVRAGLEWPQFDDWASSTPAITPNTRRDTSVAGDDRRAEVERRLERVRPIADGGPYIETFADEVRQRLDAEAGSAVGPLADFTFAIKDLCAVAGRRVTAGSAVRADAPIEQRSAPIVELLEAAGALAVGTVTLHEFAFSVTGINPHVGTAPNPAAPDRVPGGSSSGSASAVADGSARIAIGTDTGGSIRIPASFCGVVGYKPSYGLYPAAGVFPLSTSLDHVGIFAANMADVIEVHRALGHQVAPTQLPTRVGVATEDLDGSDAEVRDGFRAAIDRLEAAGAEIVDVSWPDPELTFVTSTTIMFSEASAVHEQSIRKHHDMYGNDIRARLEMGAALSGREVAMAHQLRRELIAQVHATLSGVDVIASPTTRLVAPLVSEATAPGLAARIVANTRLGNVVGLPAVSIPLPSTGAPYGLQLLGRSDADLLSAAAAVEGLLTQ